MKCPKCGVENIVGSTFCIKCGANIKEHIQEKNNLNIASPTQNEKSINENVNGQPTLKQQDEQQIQESNIEQFTQQSLQQSNMQQPVQSVATQVKQNISNETLNNSMNTNLINNANPLNNHQSTNYVNNVDYNLGNQLIKKNDKRILLTIIALLILVFTIVGFIYFKSKNPSEKNTDNLNAIFDSNKPIKIEKNNKYGYISSEGKILVEPKYISATDFYGDYAIVKIDNPDTSSYKKEIYQLIDKKTNVKIENAGTLEPEYSLEHNVWVIDNILYNSKLNKIIDDGITVEYDSSGFLEYMDDNKNESGVMNYEGKKVFTWAGTFTSIDVSKTQYDTDEIFASVTSYSEPKREVVASLKTGDILFSSEDIEKYHLSAEKDGIFSYYENDNYNSKKFLFFRNNKLVYESNEPIYDIEVYDYDNQILEINYGFGYEELGKTGRYNYYDVKNKKMLDSKPDAKNSRDLDIDFTELTYGYKEFNSSGKYGLMLDEKIVIPSEYSYIEFLNSSLFEYMKQKKNQDLVLLKKDGKTLLMNIKNNEVITTFDSIYVYDSGDSTFITATIYDNDIITSYVVYNLLTGSSKTVTKEEDLSIYSNYITLKKDGKTAYYNTNLKEIYVEDN